MRNLTVIIAFVMLAASAALADNSSISEVGGNPQIIGKSKAISMVREDVNFDPASGKVGARFVFHNDGPATTVTMGFPEVNGNEGLKQKTIDNDFKSSVDGKSVQVSPVVPPQDPDGESTKIWWVKKVHFDAGQTHIVTDSYVGVPGTSVFGAYWFWYVVTSGASWKGPIGRAVITCDLRHLPYSPVDFTPKGYKRVGDKVVWDWTNLNPKSDIEVNWFPAFLNVSVNGTSLIEKTLAKEGSWPPSGPVSREFQWDYANWTNVPSRLRGDDIWLPAQAAASWLGGKFSAGDRDHIKISQGGGWVRATVGSKNLQTPSGSIAMPQACDIEKGSVQAVHSGSAVMVSLKSVVKALGGTYRFDPAAAKAIVSMPKPN